MDIQLSQNENYLLYEIEFIVDFFLRTEVYRSS